MIKLKTRKKISLGNVTEATKGDTSVMEIKENDTIDENFTDYSMELTITKIIKETAKMIFFAGTLENGLTTRKAYRKTSTVNLVY